MKIKALNIGAYGKFTNKHIEFNDGLNIIYGPNESGKTTISSFIFDIFFGGTLPESKIARYTQDYEKRRPWGHGDYQGSMVINYLDEDYHIYRNFTKNHNTFEITHISTGENAKDTFNIDQSRKVEQFSDEFFTISESNLRNTFLINSNEDKTLASGPDVKDLLIGNIQTSLEGLSLAKINENIDNKYLSNSQIQREKNTKKNIKKIDDQLKYLTSSFEYEDLLIKLDEIDLAISGIEEKLEDERQRTLNKNIIQNPEYINSLNYQKERIQVDLEELENHLESLENKYEDSKKLILGAGLLLIIGIISAIFLRNLWLIFSIIPVILVKLYSESIGRDLETTKSRLQNMYSSLDNILEKISKYEDDLDIKNNEKISFMEDEKNTLILEKTRLMERLKILDESLVKKNELIGRKEKLVNELDNLNFQIENARLAKDIFDNLAKDSLEAKEELLDIASENISYISSGKYNRLLVQDDMSIKVYDTSQKRYVQIEDLSRGSIEQIYFSYQLALGANLDINFPLIIDDGFVFYDNNRKQRALRLIEEYSKKRQILFLTSSKDDLDYFYDLTGAKIIHLGENI